ncbi:hypothetical protein ACWD4B_01525 [Streptomyces sp. NPDC002536]
MRNPDPPLILAAARACGAVERAGLSDDVLQQAEEAAQLMGRVLVACACPWPPPAAAPFRSGELRLSLTLGWSEPPVPEDLGLYPVAGLSPNQTLVFALCLACAWQDRHDAPYPGVPFSPAVVRDAAAELGLDPRSTASALNSSLPLRLLIVEDHDELRLGPAVAALPDTFTEAMRRFYDYLHALGPSGPFHEGEGRND